MIRYSALLAFLFAGALLIVTFIGDAGSWPFSVIQLIAAGVLVWGARRGLQRGSSRLLSASWGLSVGVLWMAFFRHAEALNGPDVAAAGGGLLGPGPLTLLIGALLVAAIGGLVMSLAR